MAIRSSAKLKLNIKILCVSFTTPSGTFDNKNNPIECVSKQSKYNANFKMRTFISFFIGNTLCQLR